GAIAATVKHYVGDGGTTNGTNTGLNEFGDATMRAIHLPPYVAAVEERVAAVMPSYHSWIRDGVTYPMTMDSYSMTDILKEELGFDGFCLSDYDAIPFASGDRFATYTDDNVASAVNAGLDMAMIAAPNGIGQFMSAVQSGKISEARIDDAVRRILRIKVRMNLFENPFSNPDLRAQIWSDEHQELAREAVQKSLVLLKNDNRALPLAKDDAVTVVGPFADMMGAQAGGWTVGWQGKAEYTTNEVRGETILTGMQSVGSNVAFNSGADSIGTGKVVAVVGEYPYAEGDGDHGNKGSSVYLRDSPFYDSLEKAMETDAQIILVIISGRPMILEEDVLNRVDAIVAAWLPGSRGIGVADVLYGDVDFTGKLPHTWPASFDQIPINVNKQPDELGIDATDATPLFEYDFGLSY
ncbi:MAG: glycoside hydrolase family 3 C-terminal domain-containing protein, partial [Deltaproteobacteria bacterium]|nr:glycoside hydrolase family 3 C-terminal domain-containing protein [Deltaproteobacteria bacterium]